MKIHRDDLTMRNEGVLQYIETNPSLDMKQLFKICMEDEKETGVNLSDESILKDSLDKLESYQFIKKVKNKKGTFLYYPIDFQINESDLKVKKERKKSESGNKRGRKKSELPTKESIAKDWVSKQSNEYIQMNSCSKGYRDYGKHNCVFPTFHKVWNLIKKEREL